MSIRHSVGTKRTVKDYILTKNLKMGNEALETPKEEKIEPKHKKRQKIKKTRIHAYLPQDTIDKVDAMARHQQVPRSVILQMCITKGLAGLNDAIG